MNGGYDDGYKSCTCFWGEKPGSLVARLHSYFDSFADASILDAGCGEGKNAIHFARLGAKVRAIDVSPHAISNAIRAWSDSDKVTWEVADIRECAFEPRKFDIVVLYGLLHCLPDADTIAAVVRALQVATDIGGYHLVYTFNDRNQDLQAHPGFEPTLCEHRFFVELYKSWRIQYKTDSDLHEVHPNNNIPHMHSLTRIIVQKGSPT